jgi:hypothetical protein
MRPKNAWLWLAPLTAALVTTAAFAKSFLRSYLIGSTPAMMRRICLDMRIDSISICSKFTKAAVGAFPPTTMDS